MKNKYIVLWFLVFCLNNIGFSQVAESFDLEKYMGQWHEIGRYENYFQRMCKQSQANYKLLKNNKIEVVNTCTTKDNKTKTAKAMGRVPNINTPEKLKVSFVPIPLLRRFFEGDYWILYIDSDYQHVIVGDPKKKYIWLMSRKKEISQEKYNELLSIAKTHGYNTQRIIQTQKQNYK